MCLLTAIKLIAVWTSSCFIGLFQNNLKRIQKSREKALFVFMKLWRWPLEFRTFSTATFPGLKTIPKTLTSESMQPFRAPNHKHKIFNNCFMRARWITNEARNDESVVIILYPASPSRIIALLKTNSRPTTFWCWFYSVPKRLLSTMFSQISNFELALLLTRSLAILGSADIWTDSLCLASQWRGRKADIRSSVSNKYLISE